MRKIDAWLAVVTKPVSNCFWFLGYYGRKHAVAIRIKALKSCFLGISFFLSIKIVQIRNAKIRWHCPADKMNANVAFVFDLIGHTMDNKFYYYCPLHSKRRLKIIVKSLIMRQLIQRRSSSKQLKFANNY